MSDLPDEFSAEYDESGTEAMGHELRRRLTGYGEGELDLGPVEVAAGTILGIIAGIFVAMLPAVIFRKAILIPVGLLLGTVGGAVVTYIFKNRLTVRGWRFGMLGVLVLSILLVCFSCGLGQTIAVSQKTMDGLRSFQRAEELGLPVPRGSTETTGGIPTPMVVGLATLGGIVFVVGVLLVVGIIILKKRS